ncbi:hypothetical protein [Ilumatobacter sp.]|uniref:hypothetical protein n=1 Tax=Ilumatobacter sp. TaxID=1967498 RepID=UPI003B51B8AA
MLVLLDADDAPDVVLAELLLTSASVDVADVVAVVHEESVATGAGRAERAIALALASCAAALSSPIRARAGVVDTTGLARSGGAEVDRRLTIASHRALARPLRGSTATQAGSLSRRVGTCVVIPAPAHDRSAAMPAGVATTSVPAASAA